MFACVIGFIDTKQVEGRQQILELLCPWQNGTKIRVYAWCDGSLVQDLAKNQYVRVCGILTRDNDMFASMIEPVTYDEDTTFATPIVIISGPISGMEDNKIKVPYTYYNKNTRQSVSESMDIIVPRALFDRRGVVLVESRTVEFCGLLNNNWVLEVVEFTTLSAIKQTGKAAHMTKTSPPADWMERARSQVRNVATAFVVFYLLSGEHLFVPFRHLVKAWRLLLKQL